jgi:hypothetical protein
VSAQKAAMRLATYAIVTLTVCSCVLAPSPALPAGWDVVKFDDPVKVQTSTGQSGDATGKKIVCTIYPDVIVRESDIDTPDPGDSTLVRTTMGASPDCLGKPGSSAIGLATSGQRFLGRRGNFLFFEQADTNGVLPFSVFDAGTGQKLFEDATTYEGIGSFSFEPGILRLRFLRGVLGSCSIVKNGSSCWSKIADEEKLPETIAALQTPTETCEQAYKSEGAPDDADSIVSFRVTLVWDRTLDLQASGPLNCRPTR